MPRIRAASIEEHKELTRREIMDAAVALFRAQGYQDTNLGDIAAYVGIGRTTLYEYFSDKEDVLVHVVEASLPGVMDRMLGDLPDDLGERERLGELIVRALEYVSNDDDLGSMLMRQLPRLSAPAQDRIRLAHRRIEEEIVETCRRGVEGGEFRAFDPGEVARIVYALVMNASQSLLRDVDAKQRVHATADTVTRFVFDGLAVG